VKKKRIADGLQAWIDARKRHHLSHAHVQMARELGMNPKRLGGLDNHRQERWKLPLPLFIEELYRNRLGRARPEFVLSIEDYARQQEGKRAEKREAKLRRRAAAAAEVGATVGKVAERPSPERQRDAKRLVEGAQARRRETRDEVGEQGLGQTHQGVAVDAGLVLQALVQPDVDLSGQAVAACVDGRADDGREARVDERLPTHHDEDARAPRVTAARATDSEEVPASQTSA
jgi:hypothetical protein